MEVNRAESAAVAAVGGVAADVLDAAGRLVVTPETFRLEGQRNVPADLRPGESLAAFLGRHVPGIESGAWNVSISGYDVPQAMWARTFPKHGQLIACRGVPRRSALQLVAIAALTYFSGGIAGGIYGALGGTYVSAAAGMYLSAIQVGVLVAGSVLINKVLGPKVPKAGEAAAARQVYSLTGQRNSARLYEPIPVLWGEMRVTPDLASKSYAWYEGDDQYQAVRLLGGINVYSASDLAVGDTALSSYDSVETYFSGFPGHADQAIPLSGNVDSIAGGELPDDPNTPVVRTSSADTVALGVDLEYMVFHQGDKGVESASVQVVVEYAPTGSGNWVRVHDALLTGNDTAPRRISWQFDVPAGQYDVRVQRSPKGGNDKTTRQVTWTSLRSIQPDTTDYGQWGCIGIKIKATGQINGSLDTVRATYRARPMPIWTGTEWATANTRAEGLSNPGAILLQTLRGVWGIDKDGQRVLQFGFGLSDEQIDIEGLKAFMLHCAARGYTYDKWITSTMSLGSFCEEVALAGMGEFAWTDGSRPTAVFVANGQPNSAVVNMANMLKGGFSVDYALSNAADGIEYQWLNRDTWEMTTLRVMAPGVTTMLSPARVTGEGITSEAHAAVMARYHLAQSLYQYKTVRFTADIEHLDYRRLSVLSVSHDLTQWGFGGRVMAAQRIGAKVQLTLDDPVPPLATAYVGLRIPGERDYRVFKVEALAAESDVITLADPWPEGVALPGEPKNGKDNPAHDTLWCYDFKATPGYRVRVTGIDPESDLKGARVTAVPEGPEFWDYVLNGTYVPAPNQSSIPQLGRPAVKNLRVFEKVNLQGDTEWYELSCIWDVEGDYDHAQVWAGRDGSELRLVDGNAPGGRSTFRIDGAGEWLIVVRPFNAGGQAGQSATLLYITTMTQLPPRNVDDFVVQEVAGGLRRFAWQYAGDRPPAFAGVQIRYLPGDVMLSVADWDAMQPLGEAGDIYRAQFETTRPQAGQWTFGCRAIDTAGQLANGVVRFVAGLGDSFEQVQQPDLTPPPDVTGLKATGMFTAVMLEWDVPAYSAGHGHARTIIYAAPGAGAALADALPVAEAFSGPVSFASAANAAWTVWARNQSVDGVLSANAAGGLTVRTSQDVDDVMDAVKGKVSEDHLVQHLGDRIDLVDGNGQGSVNARLSERKQESDEQFAQVERARQELATEVTEGFRTAAAALEEEGIVRARDDAAEAEKRVAMRAELYSRRNMCPDVFEWAQPGALPGGWAVAHVADWGAAVFCSDGTKVPGVGAINGPRINVQPNITYTISGDTLYRASAGYVCLDMMFYNAQDELVLDGPQQTRGPDHDFTADGSGRRLTEVAATAPATAAYVIPRFWWGDTANVDAIGFRQVKVERGGLPSTPYSTEAETQTLNANIVEESWVRAQNDAAEAYARQQLEAAYNANNVELYGRISREESTRAEQNSALAGQLEKVEAATQTNPNLQYNGGFEFGLDQWTGSITGWMVVDDAWGRSIAATGIWGTGTLYGKRIPVLPGQQYAISCDTQLYANGGRVSVDLQFFDANGSLLLDGANRFRYPTHGFSPTNAGRRLIEVSDVAPQGSASMSARLVWEDIDGLTMLGFRQVKVEVGGLPTTAYTAEGSLVGTVARIQAEAQASADRDSAASQRIDTLSASIISRPNLCPDVDKWTLQAPCYIEHDGWGKSIRAIDPASGTYVCFSPEMPCYAGQTYTVTGDSLLFAASGEVYLDLIFRDADGNVVLDGPQRPLWTYHDHSTTNVNRDAHAVAVVAPAGAVKFIARFVAENVASCQSFGIRQVKVEQGGLPATVYTQEGEVGAVSAALQVESQVRADQTGTLFGRYSVKIDLNGYMTGYGLLSESNNGVNTSTFSVRADRFVVGSASDNEVTPFYIEGNTTFMNMVVIKDGSIKNVMIQDATIESAKIVSLSVAKLVTGSLAVGQSMYSSGYSPGFSGWVLDGNGSGELNQLTVRGTIYATAGQVGGVRISGGGLASGGFTGWGWPAYGQSGFYLGPNGLLIGNNNGGANGWIQLNQDGSMYAPGFSLAGGNARFYGSGSFSGDLVANTFSTIGGRFTADSSGRVVADRVDIRRRDVMATGSVYWGREWIKDTETGAWNYDLQAGLLIIDTGIDLADSADFGINQPLHAIVSCTSANVLFGNLGGNRAFELLTSAQMALSASHYASSGSTPGKAPRIKLLVRVPIVDVHSSVYRIRLDNFNWSLFRI